MIQRWQPPTGVLLQAMITGWFVSHTDHIAAIANLEQQHLILRRKYHNSSQHNQWFERCEDPYCNPKPTLSCAFGPSADTSIMPGDFAKVQQIEALEQKLATANRVIGLLLPLVKEEREVMERSFLPEPSQDESELLTAYREATEAADAHLNTNQEGANGKRSD
jgi:hypothetical protein